MILSSVQPGDIVQICKTNGQRFYGLVEQRHAGNGHGSLDVRPIDTRTTYRHATANEVVGVWHANKATKNRRAT